MMKKPIEASIVRTSKIQDYYLGIVKTIFEKKRK